MIHALLGSLQLSKLWVLFILLLDIWEMTGTCKVKLFWIAFAIVTIMLSFCNDRRDT